MPLDLLPIRAVEIAAARDEDVQQTVTVVIEERYTTAQ